MGLETFTFIDSLVTTNPLANDLESQGDDHLRGVKSVLKNTFAGFTGAVLVAGTEAAGATANDFVVTLSPAPAAYANRMLVLFKATHGNTVAAVSTFKVDGLVAKTIVGIDQVAIAQNDIEDTGWVLIAYDSGADKAVLLSGNDRVSRNGDTIAGTLSLLSTLNVTGLSTLASLSVSGAANFVTQAAGNNTTLAATTAFATALAISATLPGQTDKGGLSVVSRDGAANWQLSGAETLALQSLGVW